jgi:hypothetical protein
MASRRSMERTQTRNRHIAQQFWTHLLRPSAAIYWPLKRKKNYCPGIDGISWAELFHSITHYLELVHPMSIFVKNFADNDILDLECFSQTGASDCIYVGSRWRTLMSHSLFWFHPLHTSLRQKLVTLSPGDCKHPTKGCPVEGDQAAFFSWDIINVKTRKSGVKAWMNMILTYQGTVRGK